MRGNRSHFTESAPERRFDHDWDALLTRLADLRRVCLIGTDDEQVGATLGDGQGDAGMPEVVDTAGDAGRAKGLGEVVPSELDEISGSPSVMAKRSAVGPGDDEPFDVLSPAPS